MALFCVKSRFSRDSKAYRVVSGRFVVESNFGDQAVWPKGGRMPNRKLPKHKGVNQEALFQISTNAKKVTVLYFIGTRSFLETLFPQFFENPQGIYKQKKKVLGPLVFLACGLCLCGKGRKLYLSIFPAASPRKSTFDPLDLRSRNGGKWRLVPLTLFLSENERIKMRCSLF